MGDEKSIKDALDEITADYDAQARVRRAENKGPRKPLDLKVGVGLLIVAVAAIGVSWFMSRPPPLPAEVEEVQAVVDSMTIQVREGGGFAAALATRPQMIGSRPGASQLCRAAQDKAGSPGARIVIKDETGAVLLECDGKIATVHPD